jgi:hypothetical protein
MEVVYAVETAMVPTGAGMTRVGKGEHWPADDPVVRAMPSLFSTDPRWGLKYSSEPAGWDDPPVEQATAAPGERRNVRRG